MSYNQSRPDNSDNQYGRSTGYHQQQQRQRSSTVGYGRGAGTAAPSINVDLSLSSDRSFKMPSNAQEWHQPRVIHSVPSNHNGPNVQSSSQGDSGEPVTGGLANPSSGAIPKAPTLQSPTMNTPKDVQVQHIPPTSHMQNPPVSNIHIPSLQTPFQHTQVPHPMHFGGPNMHMQPPNVAPTSFQMPITLSVGNTPEIQQHPMHHLGMMHQAQGHGFSTSMGAQIHPQLGPVGVGASRHEHDSYPTPEKVMDRQRSSGRSDLRPSNMVADDRWVKNHGSHPAGFEGNLGFRPGQGGNSGVVRNPRMQGPIMSRPMQHVGPMGDMGRYTPDLERWQRGSNFQQKGLFPSPHTPMQVMHKAVRKYQVSTVADEEQAKQRQLKGILSKLTPQNFEKLLEQVKSVNIDNAVTLAGVIFQIFDKALMEPSFGEMYAELCFHLSGALPDFNEDGEKITFKRLLINKCQEEFERGEKEEEEASRVAEEGQTEEEREEKRLKVRRRMLCNIRFIGELYKKRMLTEKIMHTCIQKLLGCDQEDPHEENIEALCILMSTIGVTIDHHKAKVHMDAYFERMKMLSCKQELSSRVRFMLMNAIDLRKNKWQERMNVEGPIPDTVTSVSETANSLLTGFQPAKETIDVNGFDVFPSQVEMVSHIFIRHPDVALGFRPKNQEIRRAYMNELLNLIEMLYQSPEKLSEDDLSNAYDTLADLIDAGFKLDWLKTKLDEVSEKKKKRTE